MLTPIEERIIQYCNQYKSAHGCNLEELVVNYQEHRDLMLLLAMSYKAALGTPSNGFTTLYYRVNYDYNVKIITSKYSMLSDKNGLQKIKERLNKE